MTRRIAVLAALAAWVAAGAALAGGPAEIKKRDALTVLTSPGYMPFEMKNKEGKLVGFDVAIAERIRAACGVSRIEWKEVPFDRMFDALAAGEGDLAISGISITDERKKKVDFSAPYFQVGKALMLRGPKGEARTPVGTIVTAEGTTSILAAMRAFPDAELRMLPTESDAAKEVLAGHADAMLFDEPFLRAYVKRNEGKVALAEGRPEMQGLPKEPLGVAVAKGNADLLKLVNDAIAALDQSGDRAKLEKEWFADMAWLATVPPE